MKKIIIMLIALLISYATAQEIIPPTDWVLNDIKAPAKSAVLTIQSGDNISQHKSNYNELGFLNTEIIAVPDNKVMIINYSDYVNNRRTSISGIGKDENTALSKLQSNKHLASMIDTEEWINNHQFIYDNGYTRTIHTFNDKLQPISSNTTILEDKELNLKEIKWDIDILYINSEAELNNLTLKPNTTYIIELEHDDHNSWTKQKLIHTKEDANERNIVNITRSIDYY